MPAAPVPSLDGIRPELHPNLYSLWELSRSGRRPDETEASQEWIRLLLSELSLITGEATTALLETSLHGALSILHGRAFPETTLNSSTPVTGQPSKFQVCLALVGLYLCPGVEEGLLLNHRATFDALMDPHREPCPGPVELLSLLLALCPYRRRVRDWVRPVCTRLQAYRHGQVHTQTLSFALSILRVQLPAFHLDILASSDWSTLVDAVHLLLPHHLAHPTDPVLFPTLLEDVLVESVDSAGVWKTFQGLGGDQEPAGSPPHTPSTLSPVLLHGLNSFRGSSCGALVKRLLKDTKELELATQNPVFRVMCSSPKLFATYGREVLETTLLCANQASFPAPKTSGPIPFCVRPLCWPESLSKVDLSGIEVPHHLAAHDLFTKALSRVGLPLYSPDTKVPPTLRVWQGDTTPPITMVHSDALTSTLCKDGHRPFELGTISLQDHSHLQSWEPSWVVVPMRDTAGGQVDHFMDVAPGPGIDDYRLVASPLLPANTFFARCLRFQESVLVNEESWIDFESINTLGYLYPVTFRIKVPTDGARSLPHPLSKTAVGSVYAIRLVYPTSTLGLPLEELEFSLPKEWQSASACVLAIYRDGGHSVVVAPPPVLTPKYARAYNTFGLVTRYFVHPTHVDSSASPASSGEDMDHFNSISLSSPAQLSTLGGLSPFYQWEEDPDPETYVQSPSSHDLAPSSSMSLHDLGVDSLEPMQTPFVYNSP